MRGCDRGPSFIATRSKEPEMTTPSDAAHHAEQARTDELLRAATEQRTPRSTFSLNPWVARCVPAGPRPTTLPCHS
jgi:hypothetical protein